MPENSTLDLAAEDLTEAAWDEIVGALEEDDPDFTECSSCGCKACSCCGFHCGTSIT